MAGPGTAVGGAEHVAYTACAANCGGRSRLACTVRGGRLVKVEAAPFPDERYTAACLRCLAFPQWVYSPERLQHPLRRVGPRGEDRFERVSWDEALGDIAAKLRELHDRHGGQSIAFTRTSGASAFGNFHRLSSLLQATNFVGGVDMAVHMGLNTALGYRGMYAQDANEWTDRPNAKVVLVWGNNPAETSMTSFRFLLDAQEAGTTIVVVDPRYSATAMHADWWVAPRPGTDTALTLGMLHVIAAEGLVDEEFARAHSTAPLLVRADTGRYLRQSDLTEGGSSAFMEWDPDSAAVRPLAESPRPALEGAFEVGGIPVETVYSLLRRHLQAYDPERVAEITGVSARDITDLARLYATAGPATIGYGYGVDRYVHAEMVTRAGAILALLTGNIGRPGAGVGVASHGGGAYEASLADPMPLPAWARGSAVPNIDVGALPLPVRALVNQGDWLNQRVAANDRLRGFMSELELVVTIDSFWQTSCRWSDYILPASTFLEANEPVRDVLVTRNSVLLREKVIDPLWESRPDADIERDLATRLGFGEYYTASAEEMAQAAVEGSSSPRMAGLTYERLRAAGGALRLDAPDAPHVQYDDLRFGTPSGRGELYVEDLVPLGQHFPIHVEEYEASLASADVQAFPLVFTQNHVRQRAHSSFFNSAWTLGIWPGPILELHPADAAARGVAAGDVVEVFNRRGRVVVHAVPNPDYPPGLCNITEGWKQQQFIEGNLQSLTNPTPSPAQELLWGQSNIPFYDTRVEVRKYPGPAAAAP